ncbi:MAG: hypothetical protein QM811_19605 [Pirellulales bacterium]
MRSAPSVAFAVLIGTTLLGSTGCAGPGRGGLFGFGLLGGHNTAPAGTVYAPPAYATAPQYAAQPVAQPQVIAQPAQVIAQPAPQPVYVQQVPQQQIVQPATYYSQGNCCQPCVCQ